MGKYCDLHTHSIYSDGTYTPDEIIDAAVLSGLSAVALCDHNTIDGLDEFIQYAEDKKIEAVPGIEFSADYNGVEVHILGLYLPAESYVKVKKRLDSIVKAKEESNKRLVESLKRAGYDIDYTEVTERYSGAVINRSHIAVILMERGYVKSIDEAMKGILSVEGGHYVPPKRFSAMECIDFITEIGAVSVLAHPFLNLTYETLRKFLSEGKKHGLCGMECEYSTYDEETRSSAYALSDEFRLMKSGGSDFHGARKPDIALGIGKGNLKVPFLWAEAMKNK